MEFPAGAAPPPAFFRARSAGNGFALELRGNDNGKPELKLVPCPDGSPLDTQWPKEQFQTLLLAFELCTGLEEIFVRYFKEDALHCLKLVFEPLCVIISSGRPVRLAVDTGTLRTSFVVQEQYVVFELFVSYVDTFLRGTEGVRAQRENAEAVAGVEARAGPHGWRNDSDVRTCFEQWAARHADARPEAQEFTGELPARDPRSVARRHTADRRFPDTFPNGEPQVFRQAVAGLSWLPQSCGGGRGCRLGFLLVCDLVQAVEAVVEDLDAPASVQLLIADLLRELDGKGPRVVGVPPVVRAAVAAATASCARGWREAGERMDAWREAVQQSAVLAGLRGADEPPVLLTPLEALRRMQASQNAAPPAAEQAPAAGPTHAQADPHRAAEDAATSRPQLPAVARAAERPQEAVPAGGPPAPKPPALTQAQAAGPAAKAPTNALTSSTAAAAGGQGAAITTGNPDAPSALTPVFTLAAPSPRVAHLGQRLQAALAALAQRGSGSLLEQVLQLLVDEAEAKLADVAAPHAAQASSSKASAHQEDPTSAVQTEDTAETPPAQEIMQLPPRIRDRIRSERCRACNNPLPTDEGRQRITLEDHAALALAHIECGLLSLIVQKQQQQQQQQDSQQAEEQKLTLCTRLQFQSFALGRSAQLGDEQPCPFCGIELARAQWNAHVAAAYSNVRLPAGQRPQPLCNTGFKQPQLQQQQPQQSRPLAADLRAAAEAARRQFGLGAAEAALLAAAVRLADQLEEAAPGLGLTQVEAAVSAVGGQGAAEAATEATVAGHGASSKRRRAGGWLPAKAVCPLGSSDGALPPGTYDVEALHAGGVPASAPRPSEASRAWITDPKGGRTRQVCLQLDTSAAAAPAALPPAGPAQPQSCRFLWAWNVAANGGAGELMGCFRFTQARPSVLPASASVKVRAQVRALPQAQAQARAQGPATAPASAQPQALSSFEVPVQPQALSSVQDPAQPQVPAEPQAHSKAAYPQSPPALLLLDGNVSLKQLLPRTEPPAPHSLGSASLEAQLVRLEDGEQARYYAQECLPGASAVSGHFRAAFFEVAGADRGAYLGVYELARSEVERVPPPTSMAIASSSVACAAMAGQSEAPLPPASHVSASAPAFASALSAHKLTAEVPGTINGSLQARQAKGREDFQHLEEHQRTCAFRGEDEPHAKRQRSEAGSPAASSEQPPPPGTSTEA
ncbi:hypothetical protein HYH03_014099 [Edaphochlamys debaryana]|uniref:Uncharacterized protein n=1 Tax=Edaphochlamys debaryana TaxID=47281 RepID=A0A836BTV2_9CHLO|nr:hypothetical protein HYH03_014099 [Edaphochlamys debaryana]|eukprot:KAG2487258.1 hypothetical protein HYH03_014099 [Edaphochlamys debaryana]